MLTHVAEGRASTRIAVPSWRCESTGRDVGCAVMASADTNLRVIDRAEYQHSGVARKRLSQPTSA